MTAEVDAVRGCLLGGALGDALALNLPAVHGDDAPYDLARENPAPVGAATQLTLFVAEGLIRTQQRARDRGFGDPVEACRGALQRWCLTQGLPVQHAFAPGWLVGEPRMRARRSDDVSLAAIANQTGDLHGTPLFLAPCGLAARDAQTASLVARSVAAFAYDHPSSMLAGELASLVWSVARGAPLPQSATRPALALALDCVAAYDDGAPRAFEQALWRAARHSASAAVVTGQLLGARHRHAALPAIWLQQLELLDVIDRIARDLYVATIAGRPVRDYPPS